MLVSVHLEIVLTLTQDRCMVMWNLISNRLEIVLASVQDRCMVYAKGTIGS
jgi:hypothetical protein